MTEPQVDGAFPAVFASCPECGTAMPAGSSRCPVCEARVSGSTKSSSWSRRALEFVIDLPESKAGKWLGILGVTSIAGVIGFFDWINISARPALTVTAMDCDSNGLRLHVTNLGPRDARIRSVEVNRTGSQLDDERRLDEESYKIERGREIEIPLAYDASQARPAQGSVCTDSVTVSYSWTPVGVQRWLALAGSHGDLLPLDPVTCRCEPD